MKKIFMLFAAVALMTMTACNEKPANNDSNAADQNAATEQVDSAKQDKSAAKVNVDQAKPTEDGKDHTVAEFNTDDYQVRVENLADGTYRISMWKVGQDKAGKPEKVAESKRCVFKDNQYLMKTDDGTVYIVNAQKGSEQLAIMKGSEFIYPKK